MCDVGEGREVGNATKWRIPECGSVKREHRAACESAREGEQRTFVGERSFKSDAAHGVSEQDHMRRSVAGQELQHGVSSVQGRAEGSRGVCTTTCATADQRGLELAQFLLRRSNDEGRVEGTESNIVDQDMKAIGRSTVYIRQERAEDEKAAMKRYDCATSERWRLGVCVAPWMRREEDSEHQASKRARNAS